MARARSANFKTPLCRLSFAQQLFKPRAASKGADEKYGCTLIFPKSEDLKILFDHIQSTIVEEWGEAGLGRAKTGLIKNPILPGDGKEARNKKTGELHPGMGPDVVFIRCQSGIQPFTRFREKEIPSTPEEIYSGCYGKALLNVFAWHNDQNGDGVSFGIQGFYKMREGDRLGGGGVDPEEYYEELEDAGPAPEATKAGAGASGLFG